MKVTLVRFWMARSSARMCWRSLRSSADSGSSSSITLGSTASARAMATRCFWPPESWLTLLSAASGRSTSRRSSSALARRCVLVDAAHLEAEGDVLPDRHQRKQREVLEDQGGRPLVGPDAAHVLAADPDRALGRVDEARDHPQDGGLAAARWPEEGEELAGLDRHVDRVDGAELAEIHDDVVELDVFAHRPPAVGCGGPRRSRPVRLEQVATTVAEDVAGRARRQRQASGGLPLVGVFAAQLDEPAGLAGHHHSFCRASPG